MAGKKTVTPKVKKPTGEWVPAFLKAFANSGNVRASCLAAGVARMEVYRHKERSAVFAAQWKDALEDALELLEAAARQRAMSSSDTLLIFLLKAHKPELYGEKVRLDVIIRQTAEQVAQRTGLSVEQVLAEAERIVSHA